MSALDGQSQWWPDAAHGPGSRSGLARDHGSPRRAHQARRSARDCRLTLASEQQRIAAIGLDAQLRRASRQARRCNDLTAPVLLGQVTHPTAATWSRFVRQQRSLRAAMLSPQHLAQHRGRRVDRSDKSRCRATRLSNRDDDRIFMNIQSDVGSDSLFHGLSPASVGTSNPSGSVHVALRTHLRNPRHRETDLSSQFNRLSLIPTRGSGHDVHNNRRPGNENAR
jgi:hypothetical protein